MKPNYTLRLASSFCLILVLFSAGIILGEQRQERTLKTEALTGQLNNYADLVLRYLRAHPRPSPDDLQPLHNLLPPNLRLTLIDLDGQVQYDDRLDPNNPLDNHADRPEIRAAALDGTGSDIRRSATTGQEYLYYAKRVDQQFIRVALPYDIEIKQFLHPDNVFLYLLLGLLLLGLLFMYYTASRFGKTIRQLKEYAASTARNLPVGPPHFPDDEIGEIGKHIAADHRHLKQELTGNIAHELRTPVTGIRGYLETILNNRLDREKEHEFVGKAHEQILTLSELIRDMSLLSKIHESPNSFQLKPIHLPRVIEKVTADLERELLAGPTRVCSDIPADCCVLGNESLLYSVFRNLLDNAIRYAGEGASVHIQLLGIQDKLLLFSFSDNGIGVKDDRHLPRLFERFYRVDEGRSRDTGGSGLGLSIVKNVILFHGGSISVRNLPSGGLEFRFLLRGGRRA
jgi:signal transduction histidine kinase